MSNITKNHKIGIFAVFLASAFMLGTITVSGLDSAFATRSSEDSHNDDSNDFTGHSDDNKGASDNAADQSIEQPQFNRQDSQCITGLISLVDCNNVSLQLDANLGNNALGQK
jgi:hypothetical protein